MRVAFLVLVAALSACGAQHLPARRGPIAPAEWRAVFNDWYPDAVVDHPHPCGAIVIAIEHLPVDGAIYSTINRDLVRAEARWCPHGSDLDALPGDAGPRCWLYRVTRDHEGRRICFKGGRVTTLQRSQHG